MARCGLQRQGASAPEKDPRHGDRSRAAGAAKDRCPVRGARARLPRLPRVRARARAQHARRLPHRSAAVRRLSWRSRPRRGRGRARRRRRFSRRPGDRVAPDADGDGGRAVLAGDDQPQDRLPALVLSPPAPRGADRRRSDGDAVATAAVAQAAPRAQPWRGRQLLGVGERHGADRASRPRPARGHVRLRPARLGGDRARDRRRRPAPRLRPPARQGLEGADRAARQRGGARQSSATCAQAAPSSSASGSSASCSSTSAAAG